MSRNHPTYARNQQIHDAAAKWANDGKLATRFGVTPTRMGQIVRHERAFKRLAVEFASASQERWEQQAAREFANDAPQTCPVISVIRGP